MPTNHSAWEQRRSAPATLVSPPVEPQRTSSPASRSSPTRPWIMVFGSVAAALTFMVQWPSRPASRATVPNLPCQETVQPQSALSREALLELLTVPERQPIQTVRDIVQEPYCVLPDVKIRADVISQREVFPLAFDPHTWLVLLYEDGEYAGYAFHVNR